MLRYRGAAMAEFWRALRTLKALQAEQRAGQVAAPKARPERSPARPPLVHRPQPSEPERSAGPRLAYPPSEPGVPGRTLHEAAARHEVLSLPEVGLVSLDDLANAAQGIEPARAHGLADAMREEPSGLEGDAKRPVQLVGADGLLARRHEEDGLKPDVQRDVAGLEDGPDLHGERFAALVALVGPDPGALAAHLADALDAAAVRADRTIGPDASLDEPIGGGLIVEVLVGKDGRHGLSPC